MIALVYIIARRGRKGDVALAAFADFLIEGFLILQVLGSLL